MRVRVCERERVDIMKTSLVKRARIKDFNKLIRLIQRASKRGRIHLLKRAPDWFIRALVRLGDLYISGRLAKTRKLDRYRSEMQALSKCRSNLSSARKRLSQRGGLLLPLLALAAGSSSIRKIKAAAQKKRDEIMKKTSSQ